MTIITDLPEDILAIVYSFLDAPSFLSLCQTCRDLYQYRQEPAYWRNITSTTFRLPVSPLLKADGARWYWLYKRLRTQTKLYTWGQGLKGNLGPGRSPRFQGPVRGRRLPPLPGPPRGVPAQTMSYQRTSSNWPTEAHVPDEVGIIADLQCGGWSTSILSAQGKLYTVGLIDSLDGRVIGEGTDQFRRLEYLTQSTSAIRQFSSGRRHILALTDDGDIISWDRINAKGLKIFPRDGRRFGGKATRVVAGWGESSAYVPETGIIYWIPIANDQNDPMLDGLHVKERTVPGTAAYATTDHVHVEVVTHVVLESWVIWLTSNGKLFACELHTDNPDDEQPKFASFEVPGYTSTVRELQDVQGQFNKFAVFTGNGEVLAGNTDYLRFCAQVARAHPSTGDETGPASPLEWAGLNDLIESRPADVPALQHNQVVSLAFGDHHYHALHVNGKITSYGNDPQSCGALGLGNMQTGARFRGLRTFTGFRPDSKLLPQAESRGRQVWFEPEKRDWLKYMEETLDSGRLPQHTDAQGNQRAAAELWTPDTQRQFLFSEWIEQESRHWHEGPLDNRDLASSSNKPIVEKHDFHLDSYFALAVSAAGWHSGALVLVDEDKANAIRQMWITKVPDHTDPEEEELSKRLKMPGFFETGPQDPEETYAWKVEGFPKVQLPDGFEMPGDGAPRRWRDGRPSMVDLGLT